MLKRFNTFQPNIVTQHTLETYESIKSGDTDIGFVKRDFNMPNIVVNPLFQEEMVLVRYGNPPRALIPIDPITLSASDEIFMDWGYSYQIWHDALWKENTYKIRVDAAHLIFDLFETEKAWTIVPRSIFESMKNRGPFYEQPLLSEPPKRSCFLIYHQHISKDKLPVIKFIQSAFKNT
jgi:DNA-binding transcriptional LysR family regulator